MTSLFKTSPSTLRADGEPIGNDCQMRKIFGTLLALVFLISNPATSEAASKVFYLNLQKGCYSGTALATKPLKWSLPNYKTLYTADCNSSHHYEVFYIGKLSSNLSDSKTTQQQASDRCGLAAQSYLSGTNYSKLLALGWFFPDPGAEERKYGKKLICFFRYTFESSWQYSEVFDRPARQSA